MLLLLFTRKKHEILKDVNLLKDEFVIFTKLMSKGRNNSLIELRNQKLILRYYYWYDVKRMRTDDVLNILSQHEFFLKEYTIREIIRCNIDRLKELRKEKPIEKKLHLHYQE